MNMERMERGLLKLNRIRHMVVLDNHQSSYKQRGLGGKQ